MNKAPKPSRHNAKDCEFSANYQRPKKRRYDLVFYLIFSLLLFGAITPERFPESYLYVKALHVIFIICWMAGIFYLPRLFVYHSTTAIASDSSEIFKVMERKLLNFIMRPAMTISWISGLWLGYYIFNFQALWLYIKIFFVVLLTGFHGFLAYNVKQFAQDRRPFSERKWRLFNEIPTLLLFIIVWAVVFKPFS